MLDVMTPETETHCRTCSLFFEHKVTKFYILGFIEIMCILDTLITIKSHDY